MQLDTISLADASLAHRIAAYARLHRDFLPAPDAAELARWNGSFSPQSRAAVIEHAMRRAGEEISFSPYDAVENMRSASPPDQYLAALRAAAASVPSDSWGKAGAVRVRHPFGETGFAALDGATLPGDGDEYTIRVQTQQLSQSFRAVWEPGRWDSGGLSLPSGESGEIGSGHYDDLRRAWIRGTLAPLPFSDHAVRAAARETLRLLPHT